jgi:ATP-dependent Clp protease ATP-binding subunit ClpA
MSKWVKDKGLSIDIQEEDLAALCNDRFELRGGARSVLQSIKTEVASDVADVMLDNPGVKGSIRVEYNREAKGVKAALDPAEDQKTLPCGDVKPSGP